MSDLRKKYKTRGYSEPAIDIMLKSWRDSTFTQYSVYISLWYSFANGKCANVKNIVEFLAHLYSKKYKHNQLCSARSAVATLSKYDDIGKDPDIKRFLKGVFEQQPQLPVYTIIWDVSVVFNYIRSLTHPLSLEMAGKKLAMLIGLLAGGHRSQTIHAIQVTDIKVVGNSVIFPIYSKIKTTRPGKHLKPLRFSCLSA